MLLFFFLHVLRKMRNTSVFVKLDLIHKIKFDVNFIE